MHLLIECKAEGIFFNGIIDKNFRSMYFCFQSDKLAFIKVPEVDLIGSHYA